MLWGGWGERKRERAGHDGKGEERREARDGVCCFLAVKLLEKGLASQFVYIDVSVHSTKMLDHSGSLGEEISNTGILKTFPTSGFSALLCSLQRSFRKRDSFLFLSINIR